MQALRNGWRAASFCLSSPALQSASCRQFTAASSLGFSMSHDVKDGEMAWRKLVEQGLRVNPCSSNQHPAVKLGVVEPGDREISLQESYTPRSKCYGCGPVQDPSGLNLRSFRDPSGEGLVAHHEFSEDFTCFPGVVSGGAISTMLDCHGNWSAAIRLMDASCLPRPPLTVTYNVQFTYMDMTPAHTPVVLRAKAGEVTRSRTGRPTVEVELGLFLPQVDGTEKQLVKGRGIYKKMGALRAL